MSFEESSCQSCSLRSSIILWKYDAIWMHYWMDMWLQDHITVNLCRKSSLNLYQIGSACVKYHCPHHITVSTKYKNVCPLAECICCRNRDSSLNQAVLQSCCGDTLCVWAHFASEPQHWLVVLQLFLLPVNGYVRSDRWFQAHLVLLRH